MPTDLAGEGGHRPRATMSDVAALAGVGLKTVSRVMNGVTTVAPELRERVQRAAGQLNYRPNIAASNLRRLGGRTATIGLLLEDIANPFSAAVHRSVEDVARAHGSDVLAASLDEDPARERQVAIKLIDRRVDGLIIVPASNDQSYLREEMRAGTGVVFVDRLPSLLAADAVVADHRHGAVDGVRHLLEHGHRRIAFLGDYVTIATARARFDGYLQALELAGITPDQTLIRRDLHTMADAEDATRAMLRAPKPPTAVFAGQNLVTIGATRALHDLGLHERVALVGFDDFPLADLLVPGITTVTQDPSAIGRLAAQILFRRLDRDTSPFETVVLPTTLVPRGSGEIGPATTSSIRSVPRSPR